MEDSNIERVEKVYEDDFNSIEATETIAEKAKESIVGQIPVTIAVKRKLGFWKQLFSPEEYDFHIIWLQWQHPQEVLLSDLSSAAEYHQTL